MGRRKRSIRQNDARALLSEVLPYEVPPNFNNRGFYDFMMRTGLQRQDGEWIARDLGPGTATVLSMLLGETVVFGGKVPGGRRKLELQATRRRYPQTVPFQYSIRHKMNDFRSLAIMHPRAQADIVEFYRAHADLMVYYASRSPYSLRHPFRRARYSIVRDWLFERRRNVGAHGVVEEDKYEYEWLRSFFTYERYANVFTFYDSPEYRRCERKYGYLAKADVAKCFDSIYTHSITWATHGRALVKENLGASDATFGGQFDALMRSLNHDETSGVLIGSELSRIFAEIVLQAIDNEIFRALEQEGLTYQRDYEILRYVDDYFVFLGDPAKRDRVLAVIAEQLRPYKLHLNASKEEGEHTPWASPLTVAKRRVQKLVKGAVKIPDTVPVDTESYGSVLPVPRARTDELVVGYKAILIDTGASHHDLANYTLARIERRVEKVIARSQEILRSVHTGTPPTAIEEHMRRVTNALLAMVDFAFFVYTGSPRVSPGIKVARIVSTLAEYGRSDGVPLYERERIERKLHTEIVTQLNRRNASEPPGVETSTFLDCLSDLGDFYRLPPHEIERIFAFSRQGTGITVSARMNALQFFSLILHMKDRSEYEGLRSALEVWLINRMSDASADSEKSILALNGIACPYLSDTARQTIVAAYSNDPSEMKGAMHLYQRWNVSWEGFDLYAALQQKRLYEVY